MSRFGLVAFACDAVLSRSSRAVRAGSPFSRKSVALRLGCRNRGNLDRRRLFDMGQVPVSGLWVEAFPPRPRAGICPWARPPSGQSRRASPLWVARKRGTAAGRSAGRAASGLKPKVASKRVNVPANARAPAMAALLNGIEMNYALAMYYAPSLPSPSNRVLSKRRCTSSSLANFPAICWPKARPCFQISAAGRPLPFASSRCLTGGPVTVGV